MDGKWGDNNLCRVFLDSQLVDHVNLIDLPSAGWSVIYVYSSVYGVSPRIL